jgi:thaumarchaeosortase
MIEFERWVCIMYLKNLLTKERVQEALQKYYFHIALIVCFSVPITLLMTLDYLNIESFYLFNTRFLFDETWKGRMFYLFFIWLLFLESIIESEKIVEKRPKNRFRILLFFICANVPLLYVLTVNFLGMNQAIVELGRIIGINSGEYFMFLSWPLSFEYLVFFISFLIAIILAYKTDGLKTFSISLSLLGVMSFVYMIDTYYPEGMLKPLQMLALPAAACAAALLEILGYNFTLTYQPGPRSLPLISIPDFWRPRYSVGIVWSCAGVHSFLLYLLIILLLFRRSNISGFRKLTYFILGGICTYFVNTLRIASYFVIRESSGKNAAQFFHDSVGELYFLFWMFAYVLIIISVEKFMLVEKIRCGIQRLCSLLETMKSKLSSYLRTKLKRVVKK